MHQKSLNVKLKVLGPDHPHVSDTKRRCAHLFFLNSIFDGPNAAFWHADFCSIALILKQQAKYSQAIKLCYESLAVYEKCYGQDHAHVLDTKTLIAHLQEQQAASMGLPPGAHVCISGLISRPELNGQQGVVLIFDPQKARYGVQLADGTEILLKPECLTLT